MNDTSKDGSTDSTRPAADSFAGNGQYRPIETSFNHDGFSYRQIVRKGNIAIYEQRWIKPKGDLSDNVAYEIVRIRREEETVFPNGAVSPPREIYPASEAWGTHGFTVTDRDKAFSKLRELQ